MGDWAIRGVIGLVVLAAAIWFHKRRGLDFDKARWNATVVVLALLAVIGTAITLSYS